VVLLHVITPHFDVAAMDSQGAFLEDLVAQQRETAQRALETFLNVEFTGLRTRQVLLDGDPARQIIEYAHEQSCDLIFMSTHGHGPFRRLLLAQVRHETG
ncbi:MAG: universal stress protein, partial [Acidobacteriaceae bacterium]|nr:universal stress protein [Acidobacteriaceae bacterium]